MSPGYNRRNLRGEAVWEFEMLVNGQQVNVKISNDTGKITEIDNNKVKMIISMFGNDTVAEVNLNQIAEL